MMKCGFIYFGVAKDLHVFHKQTRERKIGKTLRGKTMNITFGAYTGWDTNGLKTISEYNVAAQQSEDFNIKETLVKIAKGSSFWINVPVTNP